MALIELLAILVFKLLSKLNGKGKKGNKVDFRSVIKGMAERGFIAFALLSSLPQALTVFAALKIATRIKEENKISNDFYLIGNLLSIVMAIVHVKLIEYFLS
ncbi:hypothetical protein E1176_16935 [Fulvivirga sp. RKSG066]|nr:hypothetical protein [Fulvivirga aurantia]